MTDMREILIRGSEKVIAGYRLLRASADIEKARELLLCPIEREQRLLSQLKGGSPGRVAA